VINGVAILKWKAFLNCGRQQLKHVILPESLEEMENCVLLDCVAQKWLIIPKNITTIRAITLGCCYDMSFTSLEVVFVPI
jgi:hypothetical protein